MLWLPIESAPRDGSRILVLRPGHEGAVVEIATWDAQRFNRRPNPFWSWERAFLGVAKMRECAPTHWMPLPEANTVGHAAGVDAPRVDAVCSVCHGNPKNRMDCRGNVFDCPFCNGTGRTEAAEASERRGYIHATTPPGPRHARVADVAAPRVDAVCVECEGEGRVETQEQYEDGSYGRTLVFDMCSECKGTGRTEGGK